MICVRVINGTSTLPKERVETLMRSGLQVWAPHGGLGFRRVDHGKADIQVSFASKDHGDGYVAIIPRPYKTGALR